MLYKNPNLNDNVSIVDNTFMNDIGRKIPDSIIHQCNKMYLKSGETYFILNDTTDAVIDERGKIGIFDINISDNFYISDISGFNTLPSRYSYYDTETKKENWNYRYDHIERFFLNNGFRPSETTSKIPNRLLEQSYIYEVDRHIIARVKPNFFITIIDQGETVFTGFYNENKLLEIIKGKTLIEVSQGTFEFDPHIQKELSELPNMEDIMIAYKHKKKNIFNTRILWLFGMHNKYLNIDRTFKEKIKNWFKDFKNINKMVNESNKNLIIEMIYKLI